MGLVLIELHEEELGFGQYGQSKPIGITYVGTHDGENGMDSRIVESLYGVGQLFLQKDESLAIVMKDFLCWPPNTLRSYIAGLRLGDGGFEDTFVVDNQLKVVVSKSFNLRNRTKRSENALGDKYLND